METRITKPVSYTHLVIRVAEVWQRSMTVYMWISQMSVS